MTATWEGWYAIRDHRHVLRSYWTDIVDAKEALDSATGGSELIRMSDGVVLAWVPSTKFAFPKEAK